MMRKVLTAVAVLGGMLGFYALSQGVSLPGTEPAREAVAKTSPQGSLFLARSHVALARRQAAAGNKKSVLLHIDEALKSLEAGKASLEGKPALLRQAAGLAVDLAKLKAKASKDPAATQRGLEAAYARLKQLEETGSAQAKR